MYRLRTEVKHMQVRGEGGNGSQALDIAGSESDTAVPSQTCLALYYDPQASGSLCTRCTSNLRGLDLPG